MKTIHIVCKREKKDALEIAREIIERFGGRSSIVVEKERPRRWGMAPPSKWNTSARGPTS
jgi:hypothetical protein